MNTPTIVSNLNPKLMLVLSRALAALRPSVLAFLIAHATALSGGTETPISFCNVLFVGNLCAAATILLCVGYKPIIADLHQSSPRILIGFFLNGCLAALLSSLIFIGLQYTLVTNAVLIARLGPIIYALSGALIFGKTIFRAEWLGFSLIAVGIVTILLISSDFSINHGDLLILGSAVVYALTSIIGKSLLAQTASLATVVFTRNFISAVIFFAIANVVFGPGHFGDLFAGELWIVMSIYALIIIVLSQYLWYAALGRLDARVVGKWSVLTPVFGIIYAFLLNGERPSPMQLVAFAVIMAGLWITTLRKQPFAADKRALAVEEIAVRGESTATAT
ncbi:MAG: DMT family transporter [Cyanobacteria bacterium P01_H01_bin.15]